MDSYSSDGDDFQNADGKTPFNDEEDKIMLEGFEEDDIEFEEFHNDEGMHENGIDEENNNFDVEDAWSGTTDEIYEKPGGSIYWVPKVDDEFRIGIGSEFDSVDAAYNAYRKYAAAAGFVVRKSIIKKKKDVVTNRCLICSKEGMPTKKDFNTFDMQSGKRKNRYSNVKRIGCKAEMKIKLIKGTKRYVVYKFEEKHNHRMLAKHEMKLCRARRQLQYTDFRKVYNAASASIGPSNMHRIETALKGGYEYMDSTMVDYKNARREMGTFVGNKDAQMLVNLLTRRTKKVPGFFFDYLTINRELRAIFWADEIARLNYKEFGDTVSFDATYRMNQYAMVFIPFIAIDNHKKSVIVGSALVKKENAYNFTWVLQAFIKAHGKQPTFVITDQCPAMKKAVPAVPIYNETATAYIWTMDLNHQRCRLVCKVFTLHLVSN